MPICKRSIEPVDISRKEVLAGVYDELECVSNNTMANIVLQLSSLSKLAEDLFSELHVETCQIFYRMCKVTQKVEALRHQIIVLNPTAEEVSLRDINQRTPFKTTSEKDQEIFTVATRPTSIKDVYEHTDPPPMLYLLDPYREDGKLSVKFYTDPDYFFELWKQGVTKDAKNQIKKQKAKVKRRPTKDLDPVHGNRAKQSEDHNQVDLNDIPLPPQNGPRASDQKYYEERMSSPHQMNNSDFPQPPPMSNSKFFPASNSLEYDYKPYMSPGNHPNDNLNRSLASGQDGDPSDASFQHSFNSSFPAPPNFHDESMNDSSYFPPPPLNLADDAASSDALDDDDYDDEGYHFSDGVQDLLNLIEGTPPRTLDAGVGNPSSDADAKGAEARSPALPSDFSSPPLKSPPKQGSAGLHPSSSTKLQSRGGSFRDREMSPDHLNAGGQKIVRDTRSDLLEAIRKGFQLRKVEEKRMITERRTTARFDVQSIMEAAFELRRKAMEGDDDEDDEDAADGGWSDDG